MKSLRLTVLISGNGSNLQALIDACNAGRLKVEIVNVISNRADARGLQRAASAGIDCTILDHREFDKREDFDQALALSMAAGKPDLIVLAGFMRILGPAVLQAWSGRIINLHPSLLPKYKGTDTYRRALDAGDDEYGASIHFVTDELDGGPLIAQIRQALLKDDTDASLAARLAPREHSLIVAVVELFSRNSVHSKNGQVIINGAVLAAPLLLQAADNLNP